MSDKEEEVLPTIEGSIPYSQKKLVEDMILQKSSKTNRHGKLELWNIGFKEQQSSKDKWYFREKVEKNVSHLI